MTKTTLTPTKMCRRNDQARAAGFDFHSEIAGSCMRIHCHTMRGLRFMQRATDRPIVDSTLPAYVQPIECNDLAAIEAVATSNGLVIGRTRSLDGTFDNMEVIPV